MNFIIKTRGKYSSLDIDISGRERGKEDMEELVKKYKILAELMERLLNIPSLSRPENILRQLRVETWLESEYICSSSEIREILERKNPYLV